MKRIGKISLIIWGSLFAVLFVLFLSFSWAHIEPVLDLLIFYITRASAISSAISLAIYIFQRIYFATLRNRNRVRSTMAVGNVFISAAIQEEMMTDVSDLCKDLKLQKKREKQVSKTEKRYTKFAKRYALKKRREEASEAVVKFILVKMKHDLQSSDEEKRAIAEKWRKKILVAMNEPLKKHAMRKKRKKREARRLIRRLGRKSGKTRDS